VPIVGRSSARRGAAANNLWAAYPTANLLGNILRQALAAEGFQTVQFGQVPLLPRRR